MKKISMFVAAVATVASMGTAMAATDGELGATSKGDFEIYYSQGSQIRVWGFKDVHFANTESVTDHKETMSLCAMSTSGNVRFKVASAFYMNGANGAYSITIGDKEAKASESDVWGAEGLASDVYGKRSFTALPVSKDHETTATCDTTYQVADLTVKLDDSDLTEGTYKQTVTVTAFPI